MIRITMARSLFLLCLCIFCLFVFTPDCSSAEDISAVGPLSPLAPGERLLISHKSTENGSSQGISFLTPAKSGQSLPSTDLLNISLRKQGLMTATEVAGIRAQAFALQNTPASVYGYTNRKITGGTVYHDILGNEMMVLSLTHLEGIWKPSSETGTPADEDIPIGRAESAQIESSLMGDKLKLKAEYCRSSFDTGASYEHVSASDNAWRTQLMGKGEIFSWGVVTSRLGPAFMAPAGPENGNSRLRHSFNSRINLSPTTLHLSIAKSRDYIDDIETNPLADIISGMVKCIYTRPGLPPLITSYTVRTLEYVPDASTGDEVSYLSHTVTFGTSIERQSWSVSPTCTVKKLADKSSDADSDTYVMRITGGIKPTKNFVIAPLFSFAQTLPEESRIWSQTYHSSLSSTIKIVPKNIDLKTTLSWLTTQAKDRSVDVTTLSAGGRIDWSLDQYIQAPVNKSVSVGGHVRKTEDAAADTTSRAWDISASVNIGISPDLLSFGPGMIQGRKDSYRNL